LRKHRKAKKHDAGAKAAAPAHTRTPRYRQQGVRGWSQTSADDAYFVDGRQWLPRHSPPWCCLRSRPALIRRTALRSRPTTAW